MNTILFPFKILTAPAKVVLGIVGVFIASVLWTVLSFLVMRWCALNIDSCRFLFAPAVLNFSTAGILQFVVFCLSVYSGYNK